MPRFDLSSQVIHFTQGADAEEAYARLCRILADGHLHGSNHLITGGYRCVCFTEAPRAALATAQGQATYWYRKDRW